MTDVEIGAAAINALICRICSGCIPCPRSATMIFQYAGSAFASKMIGVEGAENLQALSTNSRASTERDTAGNGAVPASVVIVQLKVPVLPTSGAEHTALEG